MIAARVVWACQPSAALIAEIVLPSGWRNMPMGRAFLLSGRTAGARAGGVLAEAVLSVVLVGFFVMIVLLVRAGSIPALLPGKARTSGRWRRAIPLCRHDTTTTCGANEVQWEVTRRKAGRAESQRVAAQHGSRSETKKAVSRRVDGVLGLMAKSRRPLLRKTNGRHLDVTVHTSFAFM